MTNKVAIEAMLADYFDAMHTQDMEKFDRVFHTNVVLYSAQTGELNRRPYDVYRDAVVNRESPQSKGEARNDKILMIDEISDTAAMAKVQLEMFGGVMQDYLTLIHIDGRWQIISKIWERVGDVA
ncbi:MAG: nuclear transport factor 2 family protein [Rhodoluna sp.]|nr:nuclear transport factor 2 family protein [Rhodoluna sp.]